MIIKDIDWADGIGRMFRKLSEFSNWMNKYRDNLLIGCFLMFILSALGFFIYQGVKDAKLKKEMLNGTLYINKMVQETEVLRSQRESMDKMRAPTKEKLKDMDIKKLQNQLEDVQKTLDEIKKLLKED